MGSRDQTLDGGVVSVAPCPLDILFVSVSSLAFTKALSSFPEDIKQIAGLLSALPQSLLHEARGWVLPAQQP